MVKSGKTGAKSPKKKTDVSPRRLRLDKNAKAIADAGRTTDHPDDLLTSEEVAKWIGTSTQFVELGRMRDYGPRYIRLSARVIRYKRSDVLAWLEFRMHSQTSEYA